MLWRAAYCLSCATVFAQLPDYCDGTRIGQSDSPYAYRWVKTPERCEGVSGQRVSSSGRIRVQSLVLAPLRDDSAPPKGPLQLRWRSGDGEVRVSVSSSTDRVNYRLDTRVPGNELSWPETILKEYRLSPRDLYFLAWSASSDPLLRTYIPLNVGGAPPSTGKEMRLTLELVEPFSRLRVDGLSVFRVNGEELSPPLEGGFLPQTNLPPKHRIDLLVRTKPGRMVELAGEPRDRTESTARVRFRIME